MRFPINWSDEAAIRRAFDYATRTRIGVAVGSRTISWYQMHQCAALKELERCARAATGAADSSVPVTVCLRDGAFYARSVNGPEYRCAVPLTVFHVADKEARR